MEQSQPERPLGAVGRCHWHPDVETGLSCGRCGKYICARCMVRAPVGTRCQECGKPSRMPTFDVTPAFFARAIGVALLVSIGGGFAWAVFNQIFYRITYLPSLAAIGIGYAAAELISVVVNRKRGTGLAWVAGASVVGAFLVAWVVCDLRIAPLSRDLQIDGIFSLLFIFLGVLIAVQRVR